MEISNWRFGVHALDGGILILTVWPRFFERIAKTYRREKWNAMLRPLFPTWYACAKKSGDVEMTVRLLVEMIGYGACVPGFVVVY